MKVLNQAYGMFSAVAEAYNRQHYMTERREAVQFWETGFCFDYLRKRRAD
jgi:hypothetical protein